MAKAPLTATEQQILAEKATEHPFSGRFLYMNSPGSYHCRRCDAPLYQADSKFDAGCGWPSFDDEIDGAIRRNVDADGRRTEIVCSHCNGHLGHVFAGEQLTPKNLRHCVNAQALQFSPASQESTEQVALFGGGCFWCLEALFQRINGVTEVVSGYCGGDAEQANYAAVCRGNSGHIEVIQLRFDPRVIAYQQLLELFYDCHDPTSVDQQGADKGSQYRSVIFTQDAQQQQQAQQYQQALQQHTPQPIVTQIIAAKPFYAAESQHQNYFNDHAEQPYCQWNIAPKIEALANKYADRIKPSD
ncbi:bifunctional methionine sulfoxide reductase B/A protein [uncultured Ferrimonas sp.]|uniref:bifunctional methionine sulfoxide reductase B/A protein n=1 Tax=uncultured Ferrimonas sp. TaxID=432640 RepID=UPI002633FA2F|nr:bifunctional methionine sulfoxide reductase B/A protein [uncultured Ferrimonas sp.]